MKLIYSNIKKNARIKNKSLILKLAMGVRIWAEKMAKKHSDDYFPNLGGMCAIASAKLLSLLKRHGIKCHAAIAYLHTNKLAHCYIVISNRYLLDITATQFDRASHINFIDLFKRKNLPWYWKGEHFYGSVIKLRTGQINHGWDSTQIAHSNFLKGKVAA